MTNTILRTAAPAAVETPQHASPATETRMVAAPSAYEPLYRHSLQQLRWEVTTTSSRHGTTMLLLQRPVVPQPAAQPLLERRAERALARIAALEQHPTRVAVAVRLTGSVIALIMLLTGFIGLLTEQHALTPILIGAGAFIISTISAPLLRAWRTHRVQHPLAAEYHALRSCLQP